MTPNDLPYVSLIASDYVRIEDASDGLALALSELNPARLGENVLKIPILGMIDLPELLTQLRDLGIGFGGEQHGWPPADVFFDMRNRGVVSGPFVEVTFRGPGKKEVRNR